MMITIVTFPAVKIAKMAFKRNMVIFIDVCSEMAID